MPLPGTPVDEAERKRAWTALPLRVRTAVRRMHRQFGHGLADEVLITHRLKESGSCTARCARTPDSQLRTCVHDAAALSASLCWGNSLTQALQLE